MQPHHLRIMAVSLLVTLVPANAESSLFVIERIERAQVPFRDKPGHAALIYAKFRWEGSPRSWVASLDESHCAAGSKIRIGGIGWLSMSAADVGLSSYADKDYAWQWQGPKPTDQLFTAI